MLVFGYEWGGASGTIIKYDAICIVLLQLLEMDKLTLLSSGCNSQIYVYGSGRHYVVLKVVKHCFPTEQKHLRNQSKLLRNLQHQNVVRSLKYHQNMECPGNQTDKQLKTNNSGNVLILEYAAKGSLLDYLKHQKPVISSKRQAFRQVAQGLAYLHSQKIAHRDLKLQNILVFVQDGQHICKISDLGLASHFQLSQNPKKFNQYRGTKKGYMALEIHQCSQDPSKHYDAAKTDIFALGVILFALVFGKLPFEYALSTDAYFKKLIQKEFSAFWNSHNAAKVELQKGVRISEMKALFERMVNVQASERPSVEQVLKAEWVIE